MKLGVPSTRPVLVLLESVMRAMPKVGHLDRVTFPLIHDVGRLDIAVHHILPVGIGQRLGHAGHDGQHRAMGSRFPSLQWSTKSLPLRNSMAM
jgi:hypothetical protein